VNNGYFDEIEVKKALSAEKSMRDYLKDKYAALVKTMEDKKDLSADEEKALKAAIEDWKKSGSF
jgi:F-type H+-transporting ATPase subunit alpha